MNRLKIIVIAHDIRSTHNVGALFRTCEALGVNKLIISGYTPYPKQKNDVRLPHIAQKLTNQINKTALGSQKYLAWQKIDDIYKFIKTKKSQGFSILALEQHHKGQALPQFSPPNKLVLILGREVQGVEKSILEVTDECLEIPMLGKKESLNVIQAAAIALYHLQFLNS